MTHELHILAEKYKSGKLIQAGGNILHSEIQNWNKEEFPQQWKESIIIPIYKKGYKLAVVITQGHH
jgi:hypothetical protein